MQVLPLWLIVNRKLCTVQNGEKGQRRNGVGGWGGFSFLAIGGAMAWRHKLNSVQTLSSLCESQGPRPTSWLAALNKRARCVAITTANNVFIFPETVSTDAASTVTVTWSMEREVKMETQTAALLGDGFLGLVPLVGVSVPVRMAGGRTRKRGWKKAAQQTDRMLSVYQKTALVSSPGKILNVHQHGVLLYVQLISQQQQLHQLLVKTCVTSRQKCHFLTSSFQIGWLLLKVSCVLCVGLRHPLWIWEWRSFVMTCSCPRLMSLMSPRLRFLFIKPSLMWGRCGSCVRKKQTGSWRLWRNCEKLKKHLSSFLAKAANLNLFVKVSVRLPFTVYSLQFTVYSLPK